MYPPEDQLERKWWHRLIKVLIWIITIITTMFSLFLTYLGVTESKNEFVVLSFEENYQKMPGKEQSFEEIEGGLKPWLKYQIVDKVEQLQNSNHPLKLSEEKNQDLERILNNTPLDKKEWRFVKYFSEQASPNWRVKIAARYDWIFFLFLLSGPFIYLFLTFFYKKIILYVVFGK